MNKFSERIKELRIERNISQNTLSKEIGFSQAAIARWEAGIQIPNINVLITFAKYFNVSADYLLGIEN